MGGPGTHPQALFIQLKETMKIIAAGILCVLFLLGGGLWAIGFLFKKAKIKETGLLILGIWIVLDVIAALLAIPFKWYE